MPGKSYLKASRERGTPLQELEPEMRLSIVGRVAYLDGSVSSYERKKELARLATGIPSVEKVVNRLRVVPGSRRSDRHIKEAVLAALAIAQALREMSIAVEVEDGVVALRGGVPDISARVAAEAAAWSVCGVQHVYNRLEMGTAAGLAEAGLDEEMSERSRAEQEPLSSLDQSA